MQSASVLLPVVGRYLPTPQSTHDPAMVAPTTAEYFPREQREHGVDPFTSLYVPASHAVHFVPSGPVYPWLHLQLVGSPLPAPEYVWDGQSTHAEPDVAEYVWDGQSIHADPEVAAGDVLYFPGEHSSHAAEPLTDLYLPAPHVSHGPPSGPV
jgi:hypothetical protein